MPQVTSKIVEKYFSLSVQFVITEAITQWINKTFRNGNSNDLKERNFRRIFSVIVNRSIFRSKFHLLMSRVDLIRMQCWPLRWFQCKYKTGRILFSWTLPIRIFFCSSHLKNKTQKKPEKQNQEHSHGDYHLLLRVLSVINCAWS